MDLSKIKVKAKNKQPKRLGRGSGSGWGKTAGRGNKGAGQRSGRVNPYSGFNGGNIPFFRKIPKRGFTSHSNNEYQVVNLEAILANIKDAKEINPSVLEEAKLIRNADRPVKILANVKGDFSVKAIFKADSFSAKAKQIIEKAGGTIECLKR